MLSVVKRPSYVVVEFRRSGELRLERRPGGAAGGGRFLVIDVDVSARALDEEDVGIVVELQKGERPAQRGAGLLLSSVGQASCLSPGDGLEARPTFYGIRPKQTLKPRAKFASCGSGAWRNAQRTKAGRSSNAPPRIRR